jgi:prepilin-type N-terminal cleavage/methylation domain-containing protein/prepilin-type processing-associated H-X9-DG protein
MVSVDIMFPKCCFNLSPSPAFPHPLNMLSLSICRFPSARRVMSCRQGNIGFTLVELLVVVAIMALLGSLLVPAVNSGFAAARKAACAGNLREIGVGFHMYLADNNGTFPVVNRNVYGNGYDAFWQHHVGRYLGGKEATGWGVQKVFNPGKLHCPEMARSGLVTGNHWLGYGMNFALGPSHAYPHWRRLGRIDQPSRCILVSEAGIMSGGHPSSYLDQYSIVRHGNWHRTGNNILWVDGHVSHWDNVSRLGSSPYNNGGSEDLWSPGWAPSMP